MLPALETPITTVTVNAGDKVTVSVEQTSGTQWEIRLTDGTTAFNIGLHVAPRDAESFHWHAHLLPRTDVVTLGGLEMVMGVALLSVAPDDTAAVFRVALAERQVA